MITIYNKHSETQATSGRDRPLCRQRHLSNILKYFFLGYRSRILTRSLTLNLNPNPITDPNPNPNPKITKRKRHPTKVEHRVISKSRFPTDGGGFRRGLYNCKLNWNTYGRSRLLSVLLRDRGRMTGVYRYIHPQNQSTLNKQEKIVVVLLWPGTDSIWYIVASNHQTS